MNFLQALKFKEYVNNSSVHGLRYLTLPDRNVFERMFWLDALFLSCFLAFLFTLESYKSFHEHPISFNVETDYLHWNTTFPALTVCEVLDDDEQEKFYAQAEKLMNGTMDYQLAQYWKDIAFYKGDCIPCKKGCSSPRNCSTNFDEILSMFRYDCTQLFNSCKWNNEEFICCEKFFSLQTEIGPCFAINAINALYFKKPGKVKKLFSNFREGPGRLELVLNAAVQIYLHSPDAVPTINHDFEEVFRLKKNNLNMKILFTVRPVVNDGALKNVHRSQRNCMFPHERKLTVYPYYSYSTCLVECRFKHQLDICNCSHHMIPNSKHTHCDIKGFVCLSKAYKDKLSYVKTDWSDSKNAIYCDCLSSCRDQEYLIVYNNAKITEKNGTGFTTAISINMQSLPTYRYKRNVVRTKLELVVSIGGYVGLFLGASLLSIAEIIMHFTVRTFNNLYGNVKTTSNAELKLEQITRERIFVTNFYHPRSKERFSCQDNRNNSYYHAEFIGANSKQPYSVQFI